VAAAGLSDSFAGLSDGPGGSAMVCGPQRRPRGSATAPAWATPPAWATVTRTCPPRPAHRCE